AVSPLFIIPVLPLFSLPQLAYWFVRMRRRTVAEEKGAYYILISSALAGLLLSVIIGRPDIVHFVYLLPLFAIVLAWIFDGRDIPGQLLTRIRPVVNAYLILSFSFMAASLLTRSVEGVSRIPTARGEITVTGEDTVIDYIRA